MAPEVFKIILKWFLIVFLFDVMVIALFFTIRTWRERMTRNVIAGATVVIVAFVAIVMLLSACVSIMARPASGCASLLTQHPSVANSIAIAAMATHSGLAYYAPAEYHAAHLSAQNMIVVLRGKRVSVKDLTNVPGWSTVVAGFLTQLLPVSDILDDCTREHLIEFLEMV